LFPTPGTKKWDTCACEAILREFGGELTDRYGDRLPYFKDSPHPNKDGVLASLKDHKKYVDILRPLYKNM